MNRRARSVMASSLAALLAGGCASAPRVPVYGRQVTVLQEGDKPKVKGELVSVDETSLRVKEKEELVEVPLPSVREVRVKRHGLDGHAAALWSLMGGLVTGGLMAGACSSADADNCGVVGLTVAGLWAVVGLLCARSMEGSSRLDLWKPTPDQLRAFARLPQGWPESLATPILHAPPEGGGEADDDEGSVIQ